MILLLLFAFLAGFITVLSPCILPVLPILLAGGIGQGKLRPLGIILGVIISFTFFILSLAFIIQITGISANVLRYIAIALIIFFGLTLIFPRLEQWFSSKMSAIANLGTRFQEQSKGISSGFLSGFILGSALGLIWAPCAGPILAAITTLVATNALSLNAVLVTVAYSVGSAIPMFLISYGGAKIAGSISLIGPYTELLRKIFGVLMIIGALAIALHADTYLQQLAARYFPSLKIEDTALVRKELEKLRKEQGMAPVIGAQAPDFKEISKWINSPALTIEQLKGKVVLVDFWTYSCINCVRTLPHIKKWYSDYKDNGFVVVGIHTPEFEFEKDFENVQAAVKRFGIEYPVGLDNHYGTWQNYHNRYWPAHYLIDRNGIIQYMHFGEGEYDKTENMIRSLLTLAPIQAKGIKETIKPQTPETYLGFLRAGAYAPELQIAPNEIKDYRFEDTLPENQVGLKGLWLITKEYAQSKSADAKLSLHFTAGQMYLVMASKEPKLITVQLDGNSLPKEFYTKDMNDQGEIMVHESRMYHVINLKDKYGNYTLTLQVPENVELYAFTFGS